MPAPVMSRDRLPQLRNAHHRRVLVVAVHDSGRRHAAKVFRAGIIRKTLAEIDGVIVARELRHRLEDGNGKVRKDLVHGGHGKSQPPVLVGNPAAFQASMPPARCLSWAKPAACAASDAVTDLFPERQAKTTCLPSGSGIFCGSKLESETPTGSG